MHSLFIQLFVIFVKFKYIVTVKKKQKKVTTIMLP